MVKLFDENPRCGAKTRSGGTCKQRPMRNGRCRMHGGASLAGRWHPNFRTGEFTKAKKAARKAQAEARRRWRIREKKLMDAYFVMVETGDTRPFNASYSSREHNS
jgi:hypothetical protein